MSKKTATIIIVTVVLLAVGAFLAFYFYSNQGRGGNVVPAGNKGNIFPTGGTGGQPQNRPEGVETNPPPSQSSTGQSSSLLKKLSVKPSAGAVALATSSNQMLLVRFIEKGTGNVYEVSPDTSSETRLSNTTIPKIQEALWNKTGTSLVARYLKEGESDTIQTYYAELTQSGGSESGGELKGSFLSDNIKAVAENPDRNKIFYILYHSGGSSGIISELDGAKKTAVFDSLLKEWVAQWATPNGIFLTTKASAGVQGFMFLLDPRTGNLSRAIAGIQGLTTLVAPNGVSVLYSESVGGNLSLKLYSLKTGETRDTAVETLPEKCVWSRRNSETVYCSVPTYLPESVYPDGWYQGVVSFSDDIWKLDATTGRGELVARLKELSGEDIDGTSLFLSSNEDYLFFTDKSSSNIWSLRLLP